MNDVQLIWEAYLNSVNTDNNSNELSESEKKQRHNLLKKFQNIINGLYQDYGNYQEGITLPQLAVRLNLVARIIMGEPLSDDGGEENLKKMETESDSIYKILLKHGYKRDLDRYIRLEHKFIEFSDKKLKSKKEEDLQNKKNQEQKELELEELQDEKHLDQFNPIRKSGSDTFPWRVMGTDWFPFETMEEAKQMRKQQLSFLHRKMRNTVKFLEDEIRRRKKANYFDSLEYFEDLLKRVKNGENIRISNHISDPEVLPNDTTKQN